MTNSLIFSFVKFISLAAILSFLLVSGSAQAQSFSQFNKGGTTTAEFKWVDNTVDLGSVIEGTAVNYDFLFQNTGGSKAIIFNSSTTAPNVSLYYNKNAVTPGAGGFVNVKMDTNERGSFEFNVKLSTNTGTQELKLKGKVVKAFATLRK